MTLNFPTLFAASGIERPAGFQSVCKGGGKFVSKEASVCQKMVEPDKKTKKVVGERNKWGSAYVI